MDEPTKPKYDGVKIWMDGREWTIPPLSVRQFKQHYKILLDADVTPDNWQQKIDERLPVLLDAIQRNYPDLTEDQLADMLDLSTFTAAVQAVSHASGLRRAKPGE